MHERKPSLQRLSINPVPTHGVLPSIVKIGSIISSMESQHLRNANSKADEANSLETPTSSTNLSVLRSLATRKNYKQLDSVILLGDR